MPSTDPITGTPWFYIDHKLSTGLYHAIGPSPEEVRYKAIIERLRVAIYTSRGTHTKKLEMDAGYLDMEIRSYGFSFVPANFITPLLDRLEKKVISMEKL